MAKLMKNRTDNDIKNKWNSMKRTEEVGRLRKNSSSRSTTKAISKYLPLLYYDTTRGAGCSYLIVVLESLSLHG